MSTGFVPFPIRSVKSFVVVVQEGDSVSKIAHNMTGDASRWTELVGANPQKQLSSGNVAGSPYRVFASLDVDEKLMVPAIWPDPGHVGDLQIGNKGSSYINQASKQTTCIPKTCAQVPEQCGKVWDGCKGTIDCGACPSQAGGTDPYTALITNILQAYPGIMTQQPPAPYVTADVVNVIASWYPYLQSVYPNAFPTTPAIPTPASSTLWTQIVQSAIAFLQQAGQGNISPDLLASILKAIPWEAVPWDKIPWQQIGQQLLDGAMKTQFWQMLIKSATVSPGKVSMAGTEPYKINFKDPSIWGKPPFSDVTDFGWQNVSWGAAGSDPVTVWGNIADPAILDCMTKNPARAAELVKYNIQCGFDKDLAKLKQYMCDPSLDISKCTAAPGPIPGLPTGVDWACAPAPKCIADQFKSLGIQAPCPPPGTAFPECIPEWYKKITGQNLPKESEKESNTPLYLGLTAAGIALVAGVLVIAASD